MWSILLNKLYTGEYSKRKIGHEVINFFKDDNDKVYAYIAPLGVIAYEHYYDIEKIVFLSEYKDQKCELLGVATVEAIIDEKDYKNLKFKSDDQYDRYIKKYIRDNEIKYNGIYLDEIFDRDEKDKYNPLVNFKIVEMLVPNEYSIYFTHYSASKGQDKKIKYESNGNVIYQELYHSLQRQMCYVKNEEIGDNKINEHNMLNGLFKEWHKKGILIKKDLPKVTGHASNNHTILSLMDKENEEQIYTNLLTSFFNENVGEEKVFNKIFGKNGHFDIVKEKVVSVEINKKEKKGRIDIFAINKENEEIIIIENKIDSGLNGIVASKDNNSKPMSQLNVYDMFMNSYYRDYKKQMIVLCPEENKLKIGSEIDGCTKLNVDCKIMTYDELREKIKENEEYYGVDILKGYYDEFMKILELLTLDKKQITLNKFYNKIQEKKSKEEVKNG